MWEDMAREWELGRDQEPHFSCPSDTQGILPPIPTDGLWSPPGHVLTRNRAGDPPSPSCLPPGSVGRGPPPHQG